MSDSDELQGIIGGVDPEALQALMVSMPNASITSMYEGFLSMGEADKAEWEDKAKADKARYEKEMAKYRGTA